MERLNCCWRLTMVSDTLKKSIASQVHANHLKTDQKLRSKFNQSWQRQTFQLLPREKETPLRPTETSEDLQQRACSLYFLSLWHEVSQEVRRHRREEERGERVDPNPETESKPSLSLPLSTCHSVRISWFRPGPMCHRERRVISGRGNVGPHFQVLRGSVLVDASLGKPRVPKSKTSKQPRALLQVKHPSYALRTDFSSISWKARLTVGPNPGVFLWSLAEETRNGHQVVHHVIN